MSGTLTSKNDPNRKKNLREWKKEAVPIISGGQ
jgi:hypothetical protein